MARPGRPTLSPLLARHAPTGRVATRPHLASPNGHDTRSTPEAIALYIAKHLIGLDRRRIVFSVLIRSGAVTKHPVIPNPTCPNCGHDTITAPPGSQSPVDVTTLPGLLDPVTGAVGAPRTPRIPATVDPSLRAAFHVAFASWVRRGGDPRHREFAAGKGRTPQGAQAGALAEALERRSLSETPTRLLPAIRHRGSPDVTGPVLETNQVDLYGPEQRPGHADDTSVHPHNPRIPAPHWRDDRPLIRLRHLDGSTGPWIEAGRVFGLAEPTWPTARCSNGVAAAPTLEEAIFRGFAELVERDATALWWYSMTRRPAIPLEALGTTREHAVLAARGLRTLDRDLTILDLSTNRALPTVAAVSFQAGRRPMLGLGAGATHATAASRAVAEIWQNLNPETGENRLANRDPIRRAINQLTGKSAPWLKPRGVERDLVDTPVATTPLGLTKRASDALEVDVFWIDLTDPRLPLPVARVFAPGLRHFWRRTAPGRLYDEPYRLGWSRRPLSPRDLNRLELLI